MTEKLPDRQIAERARELQKKRSAIRALPPEQALGRILSDPQPAALVHSFPESDFYLLVHDIGPEDALPLLARLQTNSGITSLTSKAGPGTASR